MAQPVVDGNSGRGTLDGGFHQPIGDSDPIVLCEPTTGIGQHLAGLVMVDIDPHRFQQFKGGGMDRGSVPLSAIDNLEHTGIGIR